jgi:hypothetical protein
MQRIKMKNQFRSNQAMNAGKKSLLVSLVLFLFSPFCNSQNQLPLPLDVISTGQTLVSPGIGFMFNSPQGGSWIFDAAVSKALESAGFPVLAYGMTYGWNYYHYGSRHGNTTTTAEVSLTNKNGEDIFRNYYTYNIYNNNVNENVSILFKETPGNELGNFRITFRYLEGDIWPGAYGNYGPRIRNVYANILYKPNECVINPLSNTSCQGYEQAHLNQQCSIDPLYNSKCTGYEQAFFNQQCSFNPLYNPSCSGYQQAYLTQQCAANPLFNPQCTGYEEAMKTKIFNDTCSANPQNSTQCPGYVLKVELPEALPSDPIKDTIPKLVDDSVVENVLTSKIDTPQTVEIPKPPKSREEAKKQARETKKTEETKKTPQVSVARSQQANVQKGPQEQTVQSIQDAGPDISTYTVVKLPDIPFYPTTEIYSSSRIRDNERALRLMNQRSDITHRRMVDEQYQR